MKATHDGRSTTFAPMLAKCLCGGLDTEINRGLQSPAIKDILVQQGADPMQGSVDQYAAFVRNELAKWAKMVAAAGLKVE